MFSILSENWRLILSVLLALIIGWRLRMPVMRMAILKNFVDKPNKRSSHKGAVPNIGGVIVFVAFLISFVLFAHFDGVLELQYVLLGAIMIFLIGIYDDFLQISPRKKVKGEMLGVLVLLVGGNFYFDNLHGFLGLEVISPWIGIPLTFLALVGLINAINLIDGIDGLSSGVALMDSLFFGWWFYHTGNFEYALLCATLFAAIVPFFIINLFGKRSKMFMGDSGALMVGFLLGELSNAWIMEKIKIRMKGRRMWVRTIGSSAIGYVFDTLPFVLIAFLGTVTTRELLLMMALQYASKLLIESVFGTPMAYATVHLIRKYNR